MASLVARCQRGDRVAFRRIFELFRGRVYGNARAILGSDAAAKDATQAVFVRVWRSVAQFDPAGDFSGWLYRVTVNTCLNERRRNRRYTLPGTPESLDRSAPPAQEASVYAAEVERALERQSPAMRAVLVLRHFEGLSYDEMAAALGCSLGTIASRLSRAHEQLSRALDGGRG